LFFWLLARFGWLATAIRKAAITEAVLDSRVASRLILELQGLRRDEVNPFTQLTDREFDVKLRFLLVGAISCLSVKSGIHLINRMKRCIN
jgi:hypothetical protein